MVRAPCRLASSAEPSSLPLSATRISPWIPARSRNDFALLTQVPMVSASLRQGMRIVSSSSPGRVPTGRAVPSASVHALTVTDTRLPAPGALPRSADPGATCRQACPFRPSRSPFAVPGAVPARMVGFGPSWGSSGRTTHGGGEVTGWGPRTPSMRSATDDELPVRGDGALMASSTLLDDRPFSDDAAPWAAPVLRPGLIRGWVRQHRLFSAALAAGAVLRVLVAIAYPPALEFFGDSSSYLAASQHPFRVDLWHPSGYPILLWVVSATRSLAVLTTLQHLIGLLTGLLVYRLVRRLGVGPVGATVAAAPVLFDAYQLALEQFVMTETLFTFLVVAAMSLTARLMRAPTTACAIGLGAVLGAASMTRTVGIGISAVLLLSLLIARVGLSRIAAVAIVCAAPVGAYALAFHASFGVYAVQGYGGRYLYGIVAPFASCDRRALPAAQRPLCPSLPTYARPGSNQYVWLEYLLDPLPGTPIQRSQIAGRFANKVLAHQPGEAVDAMAGNLLHYFEPGREVGPRDWFVGSWQFPAPDVSPAWNIKPATLGYHPDDRVHGHVVVGLAQLLRAYQRVVFVPGPALLLAMLAAALAFALRGNAGRRRVTLALTLTGIVLLAMPAVSAGFDWRYLLPAQAVLIPAGVLAARELRAPTRRALGRFTPLVVAAVGVALVATGLSTSSFYAESSLKADATATVPATQSIAGHADVHVGKGVLLGVKCFENAEGQKRLYGLAAFPT